MRYDLTTAISIISMVAGVSVAAYLLAGLVDLLD